MKLFMTSLINGYTLVQIINITLLYKFYCINFEYSWLKALFVDQKYSTEFCFYMKNSNIVQQTSMIRYDLTIH